MAEALAVIGLVSAIVQFVDFGTKVVNRLYGLKEEVANGPKVFQDVRTRLPLMLDLVKKIRVQIDCGQIDRASQDVMLPVIQSCLTQVKLLDDLFIKALPKLNDSSWTRGKKALVSVIRESEVEKIDQVLKANCDLLVQSGTFHSMSRLERQESNASQQQMVNVIIPQQQILSSSPPPQYDSYAMRRDSAPMAPVFMVPFLRDPKFIGRQVVMDDIEIRFRTRRQVALAGLGGVG
jgi:hypothetical protein